MQIVILLILTCQLAPKSNSHISHPLMRLYKYQYSFNANHFNFVQQCIQISTRINSSMYIRTSSFVSFETYPIFNTSGSGVPQVNKFEQVSSGGQQMPLTRGSHLSVWGGGDRARARVGWGGGGFRVRFKHHG